MCCDVDATQDAGGALFVFADADNDVYVVVPASPDVVVDVACLSSISTYNVLLYKMQA